MSRWWGEGVLRCGDDRVSGTIEKFILRFNNKLATLDHWSILERLFMVHGVGNSCHLWYSAEVTLTCQARAYMYVV